VLLRPLPYEQPDRLVALRESDPRQDTRRAGVSAANFVDWRADNRTFADLAAYRPWGFVLTGQNEPERVLGARVSANLFSLLGVRAIAGRTFVPDEDRLGRDKVVLLSEELWRRRFASDASLVSQAIRLDGEPYTVVGILPAGYQLPEAELWVPLALKSYELQQRGARALSVVARLKPRVGIAAAREDMASIAITLQQRYPASNAGWTIAMNELHEEIAGDARTLLLILFAAVGAVLLIACAHLATLIVARSAARRREIAVRMALGAGRRRIVRQLVAEHLLTTVAGGLLALAIANVGARILAGLGPAYLPRTGEIRIDPVVVGFSVVVALVVGVGLAWVAARAASDSDLSQSMKFGSPGRRRRARLESGELAVVWQFAVTLALLVCAGLLVRSFVRVRSVDPGFSPAGVLTMTISLPDSKYSKPEQKLLFYKDLVPRVAAVPDVRSVALVSHLPLAAARLSADLSIEDQPSTVDRPSTVQMNAITSDYFKTMGIRVVGGRIFGGLDGIGTPPVVIIDESLALRYWGRDGAIGRRIRLGATLGADPAWREIVGVVSSVRAASLEAAPAPVIYIPYAQNPWPTMSLLVSTTGDPARVARAVGGAVLAVDPNQPVYNVRSLDEVLARVLASRRLQMLLLTGCAAAALLLSVLGVYATLAYLVVRRTREVGIRVALGCQRRDVLTWILSRALTLIAAGLAIGTAGAVVGGRLLEGLLFGVSPHDPLTLGVAAGLLATVGLLASLVPAVRASHVDPIVALRRE
jgi:putative ABC transport system permease protein